MRLGKILWNRKKQPKKSKNAGPDLKKEAQKAPKKGKKPEKKQDILEIDRDKWPIRASAIVEIVGKPKEHVEETMKSYVEKMKDEHDLKILSSETSEAEQKNDYFSMFSEIEMLAKTPSRIVDFCLDYMPSSIELLEPEEFKFKSNEFSNFFNDLQARLHQLDMVVKQLRGENKVLNQNAHFILRNNILLSLKEKEKDLATIARNIGIPEDKTKAFLDALVSQGFIRIKNKKYSLNSKKVKFSE